MRTAFALIFGVSGAAALIYEVTWTRLLTLQFGHGVAAASTVLAAFMGGLAAGAALGGRHGSQLEPRAALRLYAGLEIAIAVFALAMPWAIGALPPLLAWAYADGAGGTLFGTLRLMASLVLVALPAVAMGATFPVASRWFIPRGGSSVARDAGFLYAANTVGAAAGALLAGFVLLAAVGLSGSTLVGVLFNALAAGGAWAIAARHPDQPQPVAGSPAEKPSGRRRGRRQPQVATAAAVVAPLWVGAAALGLSGFTSLVLQVVWTRLLALVLGPTTYAFSLMVAVFIAGLAIGAAVAARLAATVRQPLAWLTGTLAVTGALSILAASLVESRLLSAAALVARPGVTFDDLLLRQGLTAVVLLGPLTVSLGAAFPFAVAATASTARAVAQQLGVLYAVNTAGAIAGALVAGFVLIDWIGLQGTIRGVAVTAALGAAALVIVSGLRGRARWMPVALAASAILAAVTLRSWDPLLLSSGGYKYASALPGPDLRTGLTAGELLYYGEGPAGTVAVRRVAGTTSLAIDGKVDASNAGDMLTQRLLGHVPLLLHPNPKTMAVLGLGSGVTLGSALTHPVERVDVLEISPEVVEAARYFDAENHQAVANPRARVIVGDGRTHLRLTRQQYDVIVSEPSNPWMAGIAALFTREFFEAARSRLTPGGVLCQWAHTYDISTDDLKSIVATFTSVFPDGTLWLVGDGDILLVGSTEPIGDRLSGVAEAWTRPGVAADLASVGALEPLHVLSMFVAQGAALAGWAAGAPIQSDDRARIEFTGPRHAFAGVTGDNSALLRALAATAGPPPALARATAAATPATWRDRGWMLYRADAVRPAYEDFVRALEGNPRDAASLEGLVRASAPLRRGADARALMSRLAADPANVAAKLALSRLLAAEGVYDQAVQIPLSIVQQDPSDARALEQLASVLADLSDVERMRPVVSRLRTVAPDGEAAHYFSAALLFMEGRTDLALTEARRTLAVNPTHARAHNLVGACLASTGDREAARTAFRASLAADPKDPATYTNLATLEVQSGNTQVAARLFAEALSIDPEHAAARQGLQQLTTP